SIDATLRTLLVIVTSGSVPAATASNRSSNNTRRPANPRRATDRVLPTGRHRFTSHSNPRFWASDIHFLPVRLLQLIRRRQHVPGNIGPARAARRSALDHLDGSRVRGYVRTGWPYRPVVADSAPCYPHAIQ